MRACSEHAGPAGSTGGAFTSLGHPGSPHEKQADLQGISRDDLLCPICVELLQDAFVTTCGHTFCYACITTHLQHRSNCPSCASYLTADHIYPNFLLNKIIKNASHVPAVQQGQPIARAIQQVLASSRRALGAPDLDAAIKLLQAQRDVAVQQEESCGLHLLLLLLQDASQRKQAARLELQQQLALLEKDLSLAQKQLMPYAPLPGTPHATAAGGQGVTPGAPTMPAGLQATAMGAGVPKYMMVGSTPTSLEQLQEQLQAAAAVAMQQGGMLHVHRLGVQHMSSISIDAQHLGGVDPTMLAAAMRSGPGTAGNGSGAVSGVHALEDRAAAGDAAGSRLIAGRYLPSPVGDGSTPVAQQLLLPAVSVLQQEGQQPGSQLSQQHQQDMNIAASQQHHHQQHQQRHHQQQPQQQHQQQQQDVDMASFQQQHQQQQQGADLRVSLQLQQHQQQEQERKQREAGADADSDGAGSATMGDATGRQGAGPANGHVAQTGVAAHLSHLSSAPPTWELVPVKPEPETDVGAAGGVTAGKTDKEPGQMQPASAMRPGTQQPALNGHWPQANGRHSHNNNFDLMAAGDQQQGVISKPPSNGHHKSVLGSRHASAVFGETPPASLVSLRAAKRRLIMSQYSNLEQCYFNLHQQGSSTATPAWSPGSGQMPGMPAAAAHAVVTGGQPLNALGHGPGLSNTQGTVGAASPGAPLSEGADLLHQFVQVLSAATTYSCMATQAEIPLAACGGPAFPTARSAARTSSGSGTAAAPVAGGGSSSGRISGNHLVSCIDVDATGQLFATCSAQRLFLWRYNDVVSGRKPEEQAAAWQLHSRTKLTGLAFSHLQQQLLAACDSEGLVCLYDVSTLQLVLDIEAHDSRIWALDFAPSAAAGAPPSSQAHCFASGSDDYTVRVWDARDGRACSTIDTRANVCSVRYCPWDDNYLAVGSAAHAVLLYDLRRAGGTTAPLASLSGHSKAVSYVRWPSKYEIVSASTDSSLRLWDVRGAMPGPQQKPFSLSGMEADMQAAGSTSAASCVQTYSGHVNERNFVGLAVSGDLIAAGSETNEVVVYYKPIPSPCVRHALGSGSSSGSGSPGQGVPGGPAGRSSGSGAGMRSPSPRPSKSGSAGQQHFISSVTWRHSPHSMQPTLLAASSQGSVYVLALQQ